VAKELRKFGYAVIAFELDEGPEFDLTRPCVLDVIRGWIRGGCVLGLFFGTPCSSWSSARRGLPGAPGGPMRSDAYPMGLPNLSPADQHRVLIGNRTLIASTQLIRLGLQFGLPMLIENPCTSRLWKAPKLLRLTADSDLCIFDQCQYGSRWRKRTKVHGWNVSNLSRLRRLCSGRKGLCSKSGLHHLILSGNDPASKLPMTRIAQTYPAMLSKVLASILGDSSSSLVFSRVSGVWNGLGQ